MCIAVSCCHNVLNFISMLYRDESVIVIPGISSVRFSLKIFWWSFPTSTFVNPIRLFYITVLTSPFMKICNYTYKYMLVLRFSVWFFPPDCWGVCLSMLSFSTYNLSVTSTFSSAFFFCSIFCRILMSSICFTDSFFWTNSIKGFLYFFFWGM